MPPNPLNRVSLVQIQMKVDRSAEPHEHFLQVSSKGTHLAYTEDLDILRGLRNDARYPAAPRWLSGEERGWSSGLQILWRGSFCSPI